VVRVLLVLCVVAFFAVRSEVDAQDAQGPAYAVQGIAPPVCNFSPPIAGDASNMTLSAASSTENLIAINQLNDPATSQLRPASIMLTMKGICNHAHSFNVATLRGGLLTENSATGFANRVDYSTSVFWGSAVSVLETSGAGGQTTPDSPTNGAVSGTMQVQITIGQAGAGNLPLLAGVYSDRIKITFRPQL
jgi:hypothetical protein